MILDDTRQATQPDARQQTSSPLSSSTAPAAASSTAAGVGGQRAITTVRNLRDGTFDPSKPQHVYIGRANPARGLAGSKWANPYAMHGEGDRVPCIARFMAYLERRSDLLMALPELRGKTLYCWCAPKPCHGHVLANLANGEPA